MNNHPDTSTIRRRLVQLTAAVLLAAPAVAHAYIDPGTGSILIQGLIAAIVGALFTIKIWWRRIKALFTRRTDAGESTGDKNESAD